MKHKQGLVGGLRLRLRVRPGLAGTPPVPASCSAPCQQQAEGRSSQLSPDTTEREREREREREMISMVVVGGQLLTKVNRRAYETSIKHPSSTNPALSRHGSNMSEVLISEL